MLNTIIEFIIEFLSANTAGITNLEWLFGVVPVCSLIPAIFTIMMIMDSPEEFPTLIRVLDWALTYEKPKK